MKVVKLTMQGKNNQLKAAYEYLNGLLIVASLINGIKPITPKRKAKGQQTMNGQPL